MDFAIRSRYAVATWKVPFQRDSGRPHAGEGQLQETPTASFIDALRLGVECLAIGDGDLVERLLSACGYVLSTGVPGGAIPATVQDEMDACRERMFAGSYLSSDAGSSRHLDRATMVRYLQGLVPEDQKALARDILRWLSETDRAEAHGPASNEGAGAGAPPWRFEP